MPGKQPGGKVRISQTAPAIISKTKNPATSEVKYFGLIRDQYLDDLTSNLDALDQVLEDIQDPAERKAEGEMNAQDIAIIDGIVNNGVIFEDIEILKGASLSLEGGGTLVNPRYRLSDRISQFGNFAGRGTPFIGSGPVKFTYQVNKEGDLLPGTVTAISNAGVVTATDSTFQTEGTDGLNRTLAVGDYVGLYESDGKTKYKVGADAEAKKLDQAIYKVTAVTSNTSITLDPAPPANISGVTLKLRKRYSHSNPPPFFTENIDSDAFNAPDHLPTSLNVSESHRVGYFKDGNFLPTKGFEKWWEGEYNFDYIQTESNVHGENGENIETNPANFRIIKDGNISFDLLASNAPQKENFGFRYDFWLKKDFNSFNYFRAAVQCIGHVKIDFFEKTGFNAQGEAQGTWKQIIDTTNEETYFRQILVEQPAFNIFEKRAILVSGGPNYKNSSEVNSSTSNIEINHLATYNDEEGISKNVWEEFVPISIRYWFGQNTQDYSSSPIDEDLAIVSQYQPSFAIDFGSLNIPTDVQVNGNNLYSYSNNYFGFAKLQYSTTSTRWTIQNVSGNGGAYETNLDEFNQVFEIIGHTNLNESSIPTSTSTRDFASWKASKESFAIQPQSVLIATKYVTGGTISNSEVSVTFPGAQPADGDHIYVLMQNRPRSVVPSDPATNTAYPQDYDELWQAQMHNPDPLGNYQTLGDLYNGGTNYSEPDPIRKEFANNTEYFKYKFGQKPALNTYGPDRYDGFIKNRVSSSNTQYDIDANHPTILPVGRQKKGTTAEIGTVSPMDGKDLATVDGVTEVRNNGENYTFMSVEEDAFGNGGEVVLLGYPINSMASIANTAGSENGGKNLHGLDNTQTFGNANRQNVTGVSVVEVPTDATYSSPSFATNKLSMRYSSVAGISIFYPVKTGGTSGSITETFDSSTRGLISGDFLGASKRLTAQKAVFISGYHKTIYSPASTEERYFHDLLLGTRPNAVDSVTISGSGTTFTIPSSVLFSNQDGNFTDAIGKRYYDGALIEVYANSDDLENSGTLTGSASPVAILHVSGYTASSEQATCTTVSGTVPTGAGKSVRVYYNYFQISAAPAKVAQENGDSVATSLVTSTTNNASMQLRYTLSSTYGLSRVDTGAGLSFAESLYSKGGADPSDPIQPFSGDAELPSPPSATVTPFDYDKPATDPTNPGLGGLCYPPYETQDLLLVPTQKNDSQLYNLSSSPVGKYDMYFGSPQVSMSTLGEKFLKVTDQFSLDFATSERQFILPITTANGLPTSFPTFTEDSYTHKLSVLLSPDIAGLFTRDAYTGVTNENIFKDAVLYSNNKPVKEQYYLFVKKAEGEGEQPISILADNNPGWT